MRAVFFILFCLCTLTIPVVYKRFTCGFKLLKMQLNRPFQNEWEVAQEIDVKSILSQKFKYLNRGAQSYVFESDDHQYVIKFFRFDRMKGIKAKKIDELFMACKLAYTKAKDETGLLYVHLNPKNGLLPLMQLKGPLGQKIELDPNEYRFVIQKKACSFQEAMKGTREQVCKRLESFLTVLRARLDKGVRNSDPAVIRNFGFLGDRAVEIDFGNYSEKPTSKDKEFAQYTKTLRSWLKNNAPDYVEYFDAAVNH